MWIRPFSVLRSRLLGTRRRASSRLPVAKTPSMKGDARKTCLKRSRHGVSNDSWKSAVPDGGWSRWCLIPS